MAVELNYFPRMVLGFMKIILSIAKVEYKKIYVENFPFLCFVLRKQAV